jgi:hypothetical protein
LVLSIISPLVVVYKYIIAGMCRNYNIVECDK